MDETGFWVISLSVAVFFAFVFLIFAFWFNSWLTKHSEGESPYTGLPMRRATELSYASAEKVLRFLYDFHQYDNRIFKLRDAAFCRETGRIFQDCVTWYGAVKVEWDFLQKRHPGHYVSWGSLGLDQQEAVKSKHHSLEGFQTIESSPTPSPRMVEPEYAFTKPGPLYVDIGTNILLGWKIVPGTNLEVLIVQKPVR